MSNNWPILISVLIALGALGTSLWTSKSAARKITAEAAKVGAETIEVYSQTSVRLVRELRVELETAKSEANHAREQLEFLDAKVVELTRKTREQELLVDDLTEKLESANARAVYWEREFLRVTGGPASHKSP